jgi:trehalose synthase
MLRPRTIRSVQYRTDAAMTSETTAAVQTSTLGLHSLEQYEPFVSAAAIERIFKKCDPLRTLHFIHVSSTFYGGGVTEILTPLTLIFNAMGIAAGWRMIQGTPAFFACTKKLHNTLQGEMVDVSDADKAIYEQVVFENATRLHIEDCDAVIVHDPQPLPLVEYFKERDAPWIWQRHVDLSSPNPAVWSYLRSFVEQYDSAVFSMPDYAQQLGVEQRIIAPAINPFSPKNREMSEDEINDWLERYRVPSIRPLVVQVSRFDR